MRLIKIAQIPKRWKERLVCGAIAVAGAMGAGLLSEMSFFHLLHLKAQDLHYIVRGAHPPKDVVLVLIDQKSLDTIPDLQAFWHPYYAEAIRGAADGGAKVLGLDVTFAIPIVKALEGVLGSDPNAPKLDPPHDQILAQAVVETMPRMPVVCGYIPGTLEKQAQWPVPLNLMAGSLGLSAMANLTIDPDDFVRRQELMESSSGKAGETPVRGLAMRIVEKYFGEDAQWTNGRLTLAGKPIPAGSDRTIIINHCGPPGTIPRISLSDFIAAARARNIAQLRKWVEGKAVLLGPDNVNEDRHATPYFTTLGAASRWNTAGVEIQAGTVNTLITRDFIVPAPQWARNLAMLAGGAVAVFLIVSLKARAAFIWLNMTGLLAAVINHALFLKGVLLSTSEMFLAGFVSLLGGLAYRFLTAEKTGALFRQAVSVFVGTRVASTLEENQAISLSGSRQFVTILFSDIRGFTAFCEAKDPSEVVALLNEYMGQMVSIIVAHHGHVNKFIGDGILAVFSDQDGTITGDHVQRAVSCGVEMASAPGKFRTGIGIHTGLVVLGNVGSADKMEYTVLGDTVNVASRLESLNKEHKTKLLLSESTAMLLDDDSELIHLGSVPVRGQTKPVNLYTMRSLYAPPVAEVKAAAEKVS